MSVQTPLAWKNLTHDGPRLAVAASGVGFAVVLIFIQLGFMNALLESTAQILRSLNGELVIVSSTKYAMPAREQFELRRVLQAAGVAGVKATYPVYIDTLGVLRERGARGFPIRVLAFDLDGPAIQLNISPELLSRVRAPGTALADVASRSKFRIPQQEDDFDKYRAELDGRQLRLVGPFRLGIDFANDGNLLMTPANFAEYFPNRAPARDPLSVVDLGVVQLHSNADLAAVQQELRASLGGNVDVLTKDELIDREMNFWRTSSPIGYIFLIGVYMGFVVGVIICYQIIYSDISGHMREFATLKAMGYTNPYFIKLVLQQAVYLALLGFLPGVIVSDLCYRAMSAITGLTMAMSADVAISVLLVTILMCIVSGLLAVRKLLSLDPAELF